MAEPIDDDEGGKLQVQPKEVERSGMYFLTGELIKYEDAPKGTLRSHMQTNRWPICIENNNSWRFTATFDREDFIVDMDGNITRRGDDNDLVQYRARILGTWE